MLTALAFLAYAVMVLCFGFGVVALVTDAGNPRAMAAALPVVFAGLIAGSYGIICHVASQLLFAFRDMAVNSFKILAAVSK